MTKRMLIDALHADETRVVIADNSQLLDFDFVTAAKKQIKGNIYLAKITRVEPSLQAAFVEYGGGKQGFLPFAEIHPDYYQIPVSDRQRLMEEALAEIDSGEDIDTPDDEQGFPEESGTYPTDSQNITDLPSSTEDYLPEADQQIPTFLEQAIEVSPEQEFAETETASVAPAQTGDASGSDTFVTQANVNEMPSAPAEASVTAAPQANLLETDAAPQATEADQNPSDIDFASYMAPPKPQPLASHAPVQTTTSEAEAQPGITVANSPAEHGETGSASADEDVETVSGEETERPRRRPNFMRRYKIQEVIKRGQVVLVQVIKEERGNKGVSLSTYVSLAGRYCVLMPNSPKDGGGISRKIQSSEDRKRLRQISADLRVSAGMSAIIRTAGMDRSHAEIKRDFDYLVKLWNTIREKTLASTAPALINEEGDIIKRSIRDLYSNEIEEIVVEGEEAFNTAKDFMAMMLASHAPRVKLHKSNTPLFYEYNVEEQLMAMHEPVVRLKSGGYIVLNPTEALISIDVNSGRATGERNIEETATKTNLEAAYEIARQVRLRDLAGLLVIDFIDMTDSRHRRSIERAMKDALKSDRARIQLSRISAFGLLEMSRQRMRPSISEASTVSCPHCAGKGVVRSPASIGFQIIRALEKEASSRPSELKVLVSATTAAYLFNHRRDEIKAIEQQFGTSISIEVSLHSVPNEFKIERPRVHGERQEREPRPERQNNGERNERSDRGDRNRTRGGRNKRPAENAPNNELAVLDVPDQTEGPEAAEEANDNQARGEGRGRRGRRGGRNRNRRNENGESAEAQEGAMSQPNDAAPATEGSEPNGEKRERGRRGGRGRRRWKDEGGQPNDRGTNSNEAYGAPTLVSERSPEPYTPNHAAAGTQTAAPTFNQSATSPQPTSYYANRGSDLAASAPQTRPKESSEAKEPTKRGWWRRMVE